MLGRKKPLDIAAVPLDRVQAISVATAPPEYTTVGGSRKRAPRASVQKQGHLKFEDGTELAVVIKNLSVSGCRVEFSALAQVSGQVMLNESSVPLALRGTVIWQGRGACGLQFEDSEDNLAQMAHATIATPKAAEPSPQAPRATKARKSRSPLRKMP